MLLSNLFCQRVHFRGSAFDINATLKPPNGREIIRVAKGFLRGRERHRRPKLNSPIRKRESRRHDSHDGEWLVVKNQYLANNIASSAETGLPEIVAQHHYLIATVIVLFRCE